VPSRDTASPVGVGPTGTVARIWSAARSTTESVAPLVLVV